MVLCGVITFFVRFLKYFSYFYSLFYYFVFHKGHLEFLWYNTVSIFKKIWFTIKVPYGCAFKVLIFNIIKASIKGLQAHLHYHMESCARPTTAVNCLQELFEVSIQEQYKISFLWSGWENGLVNK